MSGDHVLDEITRRLVDSMHPERIMLFGSRAWGEPRPDSDYDLLVVVTESDERPARRATRAHLALADLPISKDILVETHAEFAERCRARSSLERRILEDGRHLHG
jgi:predicted nucleotidyltransferase